MGQYKRRHGVDWPAEMADQFIDLTVAKKWREFREEYGVEFKDPWVPLLDTARSLVGDRLFRISPWTEQHFHDFVMENTVVTWGCASSGKEVLLDEPVYFPDHVGTIREVVPGSTIMAATGHPVRVRGVYDHLDHPLYNVTFKDGTTVVCGGDHLWTIRYWGRVRWEGPRKTRRGVMGWVHRTVPAKHLADWCGSAFRRRQPAVPLSSPIDFEERDVAIDPYVLGCLIGDGSLVGSILLSSGLDDVEIREEIQRRLSRVTPEYRIRRVGRSQSSYSIVKESGSKTKNFYVSALKDFGLYGSRSADKFVPIRYLVNSVSVREDLLAGLLDTDGTVAKSGEVSFTTVSRRLADDVKFLFESLGASVTITTRRSGYTKDGVRVLCRTAYTVRPHGVPAETMRRWFKLSRKRDRIREATKGVGWRRIMSVRPVENRADYPRETRCITIEDRDVEGNETHGLFPIRNFVVTHNSNDYAYLILLDWLVDPFDTVTLVGSTTKVDLRSRIWDSLEKYFAAVKTNAQFLVPGKMSKVGFALQNEADADNPESAGDKAGIQGRALEEGGRLQGAHAQYVRLVVDELATIEKHQEIKTAMTNLRVGTKSFKFIGLANPESWANPSCQYCIPEKGVDSVNVDTGCWRSTFGAFVRHHDGFKSPCVLHPELRKTFPYLLSREEIDDALREADGNADAPQIWKMIRGFPVPSGDALPTVLDRAVAQRNRVMEPMEYDPSMIVAVAAGIDPAWSEGGDGACRARVRVVRDAFGRNILDFTGGLSYLKIMASDPRPPVQQMRDQTIAMMRQPYEAPFRNTAVDASANQGLADDLMIYAGADVLPVNNSARASDAPLRANDPRPAKETIYDRGAEAWCVLAEFCRAGQVRGLPAEALRALEERRYAVKAGTTTTSFPLRLEPKDQFKSRIFKKSPDEADACALAALAVKERIGLPPFGFIVPPPPSALVSSEPAAPAVYMPDPTDGVDAFDGDGYELEFAET